MNNAFNPSQCEEVKNILQRFFNQTNANEISETLSVLLDAHIQHGSFEKLNLANTVNLVNRLVQLAFNLEYTQTMKTAEQIKRPLSEIETTTQCLRN